MKIRPLQDRVIVQRVQEEEKTKGGIIIPDTAKEKPQEGKVVAVGKGKVGDDGKLIAMDVKAGDRILFGKDTYNISEYPFYFRMLESDDEWIDNIRKYHGLWKLYALDLPDDVLKKVYYKNALRIVPGLNKAGFPN